MQKIRIKYFTDKIDKLEYIEGKSDWDRSSCIRNRGIKGRRVQADPVRNSHGAAKGL